MSFQIRPTREILVVPALPPALRRLPELGLNILWSWNHSMRAVFRRLDPAAWKASNHNPVVMLGRVEQAALERAAADPRYLSLYKRACEILDTYVEATPHNSLAGRLFFDGVRTPRLPAHLFRRPRRALRRSSQSFQRCAAPAGRRRPALPKRFPPAKTRSRRLAAGSAPRSTISTRCPSRPSCAPNGGELLVSVDLSGAEVFLKVWRIDVGRVKLYLLDSNIPQNTAEEHREITNQLYGGDDLKRIRQEIVLGIGGLRALKALGLNPTVYHMNEGHSAFLAIERIRVLMADQGLSFDEALYASRANNVFTTHTPVPAGIDLFDAGLVREHFTLYCRNAGIDLDAFLALGRAAGADSNEPFSMAVLAMQTASFRNAVSRLHRQVSQEMWDYLWPSLPVWEVPIASITNGVHLTSWINGDLATIYDQHLQPDWRVGPQRSRNLAPDRRHPRQELWEAHRRRKRRMVAFVRERAVASALARNAPAPVVERAARSSRPRRPHHRLRPPLRHLQTSHPGLPRSAAPEENSHQPRHARADRHRRQGPSQGHSG